MLLFPKGRWLGQLVLCWHWEQLPPCWRHVGAVLGFVGLVPGQQEPGCSVPAPLAAPCQHLWLLHTFYLLPLLQAPLLGMLLEQRGNAHCCSPLLFPEGLLLTSPHSWDLLPSGH